MFTGFSCWAFERPFHQASTFCCFWATFCWPASTLPCNSPGSSVKSLRASEPLVELASFKRKPPTHTAIFCSFFKLKDLPRRGPTTKANAGLSSASTSDQLTFISRANQPPPTPIVGVTPKPRVVELKFALVSELITSLHVSLESGTQMPKPTVVDGLPTAMIP